MDKLQNRIDYYQSQVEKIKHALSVETNRIYKIGTLRLLLFIIGTMGVVYFRHKWIEAGVIFIVFMVLYLLLVKVHSRMFHRKAYLEKAKLVNEQELKAINYVASDFDAGTDLIDPSHPFSFDIDIFGNKSLFQYTNRTVTSLGRRLLAGYFIKPLDTKSDILARQQAIEELTEKVDFRQQYRISGLLNENTFDNDDEKLKQWSESINYFSSHTYYSYIKWLVPAVNALFIFLYIIDIVPLSVPIFFVVFFLLCSIILGKYITKEQETSNKQLQMLKTYVCLISSIEQESFESDELIKIQKQLYCNGLKASDVVKQLNHLISALDQRNNIFVTAILNGLFFWELHRIIKIEQWKDHYSKYLPTWLESIARMDSFCSLATYAYNNPSFNYPEISETPQYKAEALKHPLMNRSICVPNNIEMEGAPCFSIITGANMAGKSTYLRTVAINHLLACIGMPVDALRMTIYPAHLVTSLRTTDSLTDNESYFFAELKRLKMIIDKLNSGEKLFIILDEILRGTNSLDKQKGSYSFIKQLVLSGATGLIATHDLQLATLNKYFPQYISTQCFEADIVHEELTFSYKLRNGVAQNMNACFLMKKMGINIE
ncbi:MAG: hypothetical protein GX416_10340 [Bacteroidales bacterium]|nr:hypothetical protein [Bacteroidales bacterium]